MHPVPRGILHHARGKNGLVHQIESCSSTWLFDEPRKRFLRGPRGSKPELLAAAVEWEEYHRLDESDDGSFVVVLNEDGTRRLRSHRHVEGCQRCGEAPTEELSLQSIKDELST